MIIPVFGRVMHHRLLESELSILIRSGNSNFTPVFELNRCDGLAEDLKKSNAVVGIISPTDYKLLLLEDILWITIVRPWLKRRDEEENFGAMDEKQKIEYCHVALAAKKIPGYKIVGRLHGEIAKVNSYYS